MYEDWFEDQDVKVVLETQMGLVFVHLAVYHWSLARFKKIRRLLASLKQQMRERGHSHIHAYNTKQNTKWFRFVESMGFRPHAAHNGLVIYKVSC